MKYFDSETWLITAQIEIVVHYKECIKNIHELIMKYYEYIKLIEYLKVIKLVNGNMNIWIVLWILSLLSWKNLWEVLVG